MTTFTDPTGREVVVAFRPHRSETPPSEPSEPSEPDWRYFANCLGVDPNLFFPDRGEDVAPAVAVCEGCSVRQPCLDEALGFPYAQDVGIRGGTSQRERLAMRRNRQQVESRQRTESHDPRH